jgi:glycolate oxidase FAD binding subunit
MDSSRQITIDGIVIQFATPANVEELADQVRQCAANSTAMFSIGGQTALDYGRPPSRSGVALSLSQLNRVVDYPVEDLTITVEAGMEVSELYSILAKNNQRLPIDVPNAETATIGGAIAVNAAGPRRLAYGTWRDWIIGMMVINDRGELCKSGGRVVKNVAGYDLGKLYTGSLGTLGIIVQVTLKLQPRPESMQWVAIEGISRADVGALLNRIHESATQPRAVELISQSENFDCMILFEDNRESVQWQVEQIQKELAGRSISLLNADAGQALTERPGIAKCNLQVIATMKSSQLAALLNSNVAHGWSIQAHAANGIVWAGRDTDQLSEAQKLIHELSEVVHSMGGNVVIRRCPIGWKSTLPIWGQAPVSLSLMKKVKQELDPNNVLNPGRTLV